MSIAWEVIVILVTRNSSWLVEMATSRICYNLARVYPKSDLSYLGTCVIFMHHHILLQSFRIHVIMRQFNSYESLYIWKCVKVVDTSFVGWRQYKWPVLMSWSSKIHHYLSFFCAWYESQFLNLNHSKGFYFFFMVVQFFLSTNKTQKEFSIMS